LKTSQTLEAKQLNVVKETTNEITKLTEQKNQFALKLQTLRQTLIQIQGGKTEAEWQKLLETATSGRAALQALEVSLSRLDELKRGLEQQEAEGARLQQDLASHIATEKELKLTLEALELNSEQAIKQFEAIELVLSLEERRKELRPGEACPLCGSLEHPFVKGLEFLTSRKDQAKAEVQRWALELKKTQTGMTEIRRILNNLEGVLKATAKQLVTQRKEITEAEAQVEIRKKNAGVNFKSLECSGVGPAVIAIDQDIALTSEKLRRIRTTCEDISQAEKASLFIEAQLNICEAKRANAETNANAMRATIEQVQVQIQASQNSICQMQNSIAVVMQRLNEKAATFSEAELSLERLEKREITWQRAKEELGELRRNRQTQMIEIQHSEETVRNETVLHEQSQLQLDELRKKAAARKVERESIFGTRQVKQVENEIEEKLKASRGNLKDADNRTAMALPALHTAQARLEELRKQMTSLSLERDTVSAQLLPKVISASFANLAETLAARLEPDIARTLMQRDRNLQNEEQSLKATRTLIESELHPLANFNLPNEALESLRKELEKTQAERDKLQQEIGGIVRVVELDTERRKQLEADAQHLAEQRDESMRWKRLDELIGSANGANFARFAQGITLGKLVQLANHHLERLNPRYQMLRNPETDLDLRIMDRYQGGVIRPMESLSGGESFLASLALALGVSELAGRSTSIDSLFIDEGFGSLDSNTLEVAMAALENLQARGKTIGIISHLDLMKERISTQIRLSRDAQGCAHLDVVS
jgi:exonuclease SbcC